MKIIGCDLFMQLILVFMWDYSEYVLCVEGLQQTNSIPHTVGIIESWCLMK